MTGGPGSAIAERAAQPDDVHEQGQDRPPPISTVSSSQATVPGTYSEKHSTVKRAIGDLDEEEQEDVPYNISDRHLPWLLRPIPHAQIDGAAVNAKKGPAVWVSERLLTRNWLGLFYDVSHLISLELSSLCLC
jgi:hypothetical protein